MIECSHLPSLIHLAFTDGHIPMSSIDANRFFDYVWSLPKLTYCYLDICFNYENYFPNPTVTSTSIKHLVIQHMCCDLNQLAHLCQRAPCLKYLSINFEDHSDQFESSPSAVFSLNQLKIVFTGSRNILQQLLQTMPHLNHFILETYNMCIDGYQWEQMIRKCLPKLNVFRLKMRFLPADNESKEVQFNQIIDSFRTKFWIDEHQWFVRSHLVQLDNQVKFDYIDLFTLPYTFDNFPNYPFCELAKSTCPYDDEYLICDRVINLHYGSTHFTSLIMSHVRFTSIEYLSLSFPFNDQFLSVVSKLDRLISLYVSVDKTKNLDNIQSQLQLVLDRAPRLHLLSFGVWPTSTSQVPSMDLTGVSIRRLDLQGYEYDNRWRCLDDEQYTQLSRSPLAMQCETLLVKVKNRRNVVDLVKKTPNLQSLNVRCEDDSWSDEDDLLLRKDDELIAWFREHLPSTCSIMRDTYLGNDVRLWIR